MPSQTEKSSRAKQIARTGGTQTTDLFSTTGTYIWTTCAAGWTTIWYMTQLPEAGVTAMGCCIMAILWRVLQK